MPIELRTGLPGAGKTLGAVESMMERRKKEPERPLYHFGVTDLRDGIAIPLDQKGVEAWDQLPAGSVLYVDEVQKLMPAKRGTANTPEWIRRLSEHRYLGLDFVFITQHPSLIDSYVRTLVDRHIHTVRDYGTKAVQRYTWPICVSDPNSKSNKKTAEGKSRHLFSKQAMQAYKSSELHTIKPKIPKFLKIAACLLVAVPIMGYAAYKVMDHASHKKTIDGQTATVDEGPKPVGEPTGKHVLSPQEWVHQQVPRVAGIPWSAPIFDDQKVQTQPDLYCIEIEAEHGVKRCDCITEQGTKAQVPHAMCVAFVHDGVYNPYRKPLETRVAMVTGNNEKDARPLPAQQGGQSVSSFTTSTTTRLRPGIGTDYVPPSEQAQLTPAQGYVK